MEEDDDDDDNDDDDMSIFRKSVEKTQVRLKPDNLDRYFTKTPIHISYHISLNSS
jgi:hypothetical protein